MVIYLLLLVNIYMTWRVLVTLHELLNEQISSDVWTEFIELLDEGDDYDPESDEW